MQVKDFPAVQEARRAAHAQLNFYKEMMGYPLNIKDLPDTDPLVIAYSNFNKLPPHQQRVIGEKSELDIKLESLRSFIYTSDMYNTLPEDERRRLVIQSVIMRDYSDILDERIKCFDTTTN